MRAALPLLLSLSSFGCGGGSSDVDAGSVVDGGGVDAARVDTGPETDAGTVPDAGPGSDAGAPMDAGASSDAYRGATIFEEHFEDDLLMARGWYDGPMAEIDAAENAPGGSGHAFACHWTAGATSCAGGKPARHHVAPQDALYLSFWVKHTASWVGSGRAYHPHLFHFTTTDDGDYVGPSYSHLTTYIEHVGGYGIVALQDSQNVDLGCLLRNDDSVVGCGGGSFASYTFTEMRSAASCNGLAGDLPSRDCFPNGDGTWYSSRGARTAAPIFTTTPGPTFQGDWHHVETYMRLNSITAGIGNADGKIRYWVDGALQISSDATLFRTGAHPTMQFDHVLCLPYIGDGSPMDQTMWIDEIVVAAGT